MTSAITPSETGKRTALVLAGGIAMGAFEAGAYAGLDEAGLAGSLAWVAGSLRIPMISDSGSD